MQGKFPLPVSLSRAVDHGNSFSVVRVDSGTDLEANHIHLCIPGGTALSPLLRDRRRTAELHPSRQKSFFANESKEAQAETRPTYTLISNRFKLLLNEESDISQIVSDRFQLALEGETVRTREKGTMKIGSVSMPVVRHLNPMTTLARKHLGRSFMPIGRIFERPKFCPRFHALPQFNNMLWYRALNHYGLVGTKTERSTS